VINKDTAIRLAPVAPFPCIRKDPVRGFLWTQWPHEDGYDVAKVWDHYTDQYGVEPAPAFEPGAHGLIGIDIDRKPGNPDGIALFNSLLDEYGDLPPCPVTISPSIGYHFILKQQPGRAPLGNREGWFYGKGVNIRGKGGYLLCAGATIIDPETGECFDYKSAPGFPGLLEAFLSNTIPVIPDWLVALIEDGREPDNEPLGCPTQQATVTPCSGAWNTARADAFLEPILAERTYRLAAMPAETGRNNYLNESTFYISGRRHNPVLANTSIDINEVWSAFEWAYAQHPSRKRNARQRFRKTFMSGWNDGRRKPCREPKPDPVTVPMTVRIGGEEFQI
jgi:hypothetical protein